MKRLSWRGAVTAAILVSQAGLASAQWIEPEPPLPNTDATRVTWSVSASDASAIDFADVVRASVTPLSPASVPALPQVVGADTPVGVTVYFPALNTSRDAVTGLATSVSSAGGVRISLPKTHGIALGGQITLSNWGLNAVTRQLTADITGAYGLPSQAQVAVFTLGDFSVTGDSTSFSLWLTQAGADAFTQAVGLNSLGLVGLENARASSFGSVTVDVAMVPEPTSYALAMAGVVVALAAARRSRRSTTEAQPA